MPHSTHFSAFIATRLPWRSDIVTGDCIPGYTMVIAPRTHELEHVPRLAEVRSQSCDVAVIFSRDQDLSEVADEVRAIAIQQNRWVKLVRAFPSSPTYNNKRGINKTDWVRIDRAMYDACLDPNDYRPKQQSKP